MIRGFVTGLVWGGVVAVAGLAVISQVAPLPRPVPMETAPEPVATPEPVVLPEPSEAPADETPAAETPAATATPEPLADPVPTPDPTPSATPAPPPVIAGDAAPDSPAQPEAVSDPAALPLAGSGAKPATEPLATPAPATAEDAPATTDPLPSPPQELLLEPAPVAPKILKPAGEAMPGDAPRLIVPDGKPLTESPLPAPEAALPRIGEPAATLQPNPTPATALDLFARPFDNPGDKPLFAILLVDDGAAGTDRETLAALPFPVTFVLDPLAPGADEAAAIYRKAGQEIVLLANAIPQGATPEDLEQSLQALDLALPDAVAVMGGDALPQDSQKLAAAFVPIIGAQGRGLVTMDRGLNALDQVARRDSVPTASVFRILDAGNETIPVIRRYLDRAAFRAAQEGSVVVMGSTKPDTIAAILQWNVEGRAASVALAPISAIMRAADPG